MAQSLSCDVRFSSPLDSIGRLFPCFVDPRRGDVDYVEEGNVPLRKRPRAYTI